MLVAPVTVGDGAYTAAGSIITADVAPGDLAVARGKQRNIDGWVARRRAGTTYGRGGRAALARSRPSTADRSRHDAARTTEERSDGMSFIKTTGEKKLMLFSGRAHPELAEEVGDELGVELDADDGLRLRQRRDLRALRGVGARLRRVRHAEPRRADQHSGSWSS